MNRPSDKAGYEPGRLRRAAQLGWKRLGPQQFRVRGQDEPFYDVDLSVDPPCYCADQLHRGPGCKHELCGRMANGDMALIQALGDMLQKAQQANRELTRQRRKRSA